MPSLAALAKHAGSSVYHLHRIFKAVTGVTPKALRQCAPRQAPPLGVIFHDAT